ncbi:hypothetical protein PC129_g11047 [Phytophthora cactorum]|uniref:PH domain-containing protein n=2 Tax=Phytophthora cactorum TaxID=29920 RepID=A0A8T1HYT8_9STRA|nr:hypothetical protein PC113_g3815 [Phytophthora cactorum]KAG2924997.1 hypothetical protein PC114_g4269 [Phytophthora cactorum]KAG2950990.1 hypothetical protein PC117_g3969 [Phytophthora cactorum]KAG3032184.1 hypothetical protein PC120_g2611 [Phytophthora cactorum]KAG3037487.1 hypothetical protein PC119_g3588 [Phytophthora cactorum]
MKMRSCGLFWHKAVVSLKFTSCLSLDQPQQGLLTIARRKMFGGKMEISLDNNTTSLISVSGKEARHYQLKVRFGPRFHVVTLRAPTSAIYETWWSALKNALASPNFAVLPVIDARARQVTIAPVLPARRNISLPKHVTTLETVVEAASEEELVDDIPMLEVGGPSSPSETDILASWRTWASLDYFATPPSITGPLSSSESPEVTADCIKDDSSSSDRISVYSDISEFWSRPSEWEDETPYHDPAPATKSFTTCESKTLISQNCMAPQPQDDEEKWLDEIALFAFRQKVGASRKSERRPSRRITERLHPLLTYALF